jgi:hypothetical protein
VATRKCLHTAEPADRPRQTRAISSFGRSESADCFRYRIAYRQNARLVRSSPVVSCDCFWMSVEAAIRILALRERQFGCRARPKSRKLVLGFAQPTARIFFGVILNTFRRAILRIGADVIERKVPGCFARISAPTSRRRFDSRNPQTAADYQPLRFGGLLCEGSATKRASLSSSTRSCWR